ncbi:MAG: hypothetical protein O2780_02820 [Proteobacteria bacterium]|nr:hypothetical protein [Pseudomonadota bacterium]MDA1299931.1 hypothetical protein [Pseudomonadota bacterium]
MRQFNRHQLDQFIKKQSILKGTPERPGLMQSDENEIIKAFYRRKTISTSRLVPQARRFTTNSRLLLERDIPAPIVKDVVWCADYPVHMVIYDRIDGKDLRELCHELGTEQISMLPDFLARLHDQGVFFRAIHLGNLIFDGDTIHLVDISDLRLHTSPLGVFARARNLAHLMNTERDKAYFVSYGVDRFIAEYEAAAGRSSALFRLRLNWTLDGDLK